MATSITLVYKLPLSDLKKAVKLEKALIDVRKTVLEVDEPNATIMERHSQTELTGPAVSVTLQAANLEALMGPVRSYVAYGLAEAGPPAFVGGNLEGAKNALHPLYKPVFPWRALFTDGGLYNLILGYRAVRPIKA